MTPITILHSPACGTSRNVLALIRNSGVEPQVVEYLKQLPSRDELVQLLAAMQMPVRVLLRRNGNPYDARGLGDSRWTDEQLLDFAVQHPITVSQPIAVTPLGTRLCRPSEAVLDLLPDPRRGAFKEEDGEHLIGAKGRRVAR